MYSYNYTDELQHYGVMGMKWGVRRNSLKAYSKASAKADKLNSKKASKNFEVERLRKKLAAAEAASIKSNTKAEKWMHKMDKVFSEKNLSKIEAKHIKNGEKFLRKAVEAEEPYDSAVNRNKSDKHYKEAENVKRLRTDRNEAMNYYELERRKK